VSDDYFDFDGEGYDPRFTDATPTMALFDSDDIIALGANVGSSDNRKSMFNRIKSATRAKYVTPPPRREDVHKVFDELILTMPNFTDVIEHLRKQAVLRSRSSKPIMGSQPLLLIGDPGVGKTFFSERLAAAIGLEYHAIDMASLSASFELVGGSSLWAESNFGRIFGCLINGETINPLILLDEVEKAPKGQYPVNSALFRMLNPTQSKKFIDEAVNPLAIDASRILYILTANTLDEVHVAIIDRCLVFNIEQPTRTQSINVAKSVWASIRAGESWAKSFDETLSNDVLYALSVQTPRAMKKSLENAMATCALRSDSGEILAADIADARAATARRIGF